MRLRTITFDMILVLAASGEGEGGPSGADEVAITAGTSAEPDDAGDDGQDPARPTPITVEGVGSSVVTHSQGDAVETPVIDGPAVPVEADFVRLSEPGDFDDLEDLGARHSSQAAAEPGRDRSGVEAAWWLLKSVAWV